MATAEECRQALVSLTGRIMELSAEERAAHLVQRDISCQVTDIGVTFMASIGPDGAGPVREANGSEPRAQIRMTAKSEDLVALSADPGTFAKAWLSGRIRIEASLSDVFRLRKLL